MCDCDTHWGYCPGSRVHGGNVIEMKHNVSLCPEAHLIYSCSGMWTCEMQQLFLFSSLPVYFTECAVQNELALFPSEEEGSLEMDYLMGFTLLYITSLSSINSICALLFLKNSADCVCLHQLESIHLLPGGRKGTGGLWGRALFSSIKYPFRHFLNIRQSLPTSFSS